MALGVDETRIGCCDLLWRVATPTAAEQVVCFESSKLWSLQPMLQLFPHEHFNGNSFVPTCWDVRPTESSWKSSCSVAQRYNLHASQWFTHQLTWSQWALEQCWLSCHGFVASVVCYPDLWWFMATQLVLGISPWLLVIAHKLTIKVTILNQHLPALTIINQHESTSINLNEPTLTTQP